MENPAPKVFSGMISGREIFVCDGYIGPTAIAHVAGFLNTLSYRRAEHSIPGVPVSGASAELAPSLLASEAFFGHLKSLADNVFASERLTVERAYVNNTVYGDMYYTHRDCEPGSRDVTLLYYANPAWENDWGGETIYFNDEDDAQIVVRPRAGRLVIARGAILHRGGVPTRICHEERRTIALKMGSAPKS